MCQQAATIWPEKDHGFLTQGRDQASDSPDVNPITRLLFSSTRRCLVGNTVDFRTREILAKLVNSVTPV